MTLNQFISLLNDDLRREYQHMLFYVHAANMLIGPERLYLVDTLKKHAASEMEHVWQFGHKIRANGDVPNPGLEAPEFAAGCTCFHSVVAAALTLEEEVVKNYHERHAQAQKLHEETGKHYDLVVFLEEQIEHSQGDVDELKLLALKF